VGRFRGMFGKGVLKGKMGGKMKSRQLLDGATLG
jgi:hypothetical protein